MCIFGDYPIISRLNVLVGQKRGGVSEIPVVSSWFLMQSPKGSSSLNCKKPDSAFRAKKGGFYFQGEDVPKS